MKNQKIFWAANLKFLRTRKNLSQDELAASLDITRVSLNAHEHGRTKNPPVDILLAVSVYFKMSIDTLLKVDLSKIGELKLRELEAGNDVYTSGGNLRVLAITVDKRNRENVEYVPVQAKAGYAAGYHDRDYIASLPKYTLPGLPKSGTFRIFPISGDSMLPVADGSDIVAKYVENWNSIKAGTPCIVVLKGEQELVFKKVTITGEGTAQLVSSNTQYQPYTVALSEVVEIWEFHSYISRQMPEAGGDLAGLYTMVREIKETLGNR